MHLHLEGSIRPAIASALAARHGVELEEEEVRRRYEYTNFAEFLDAFKWVTSFVREPKDFALIAADLAEQLLEQKVAYAEVTLSVGVMFLRQQQPEANFAAILKATELFERRGKARVAAELDIRCGAAVWSGGCDARGAGGTAVRITADCGVWDWGR